jgi:hypothetical protein
VAEVEISEAKNRQGKEWGERLLKKSLKAGRSPELKSIRDRLLRDLHTHTEGSAQEDDITFVLVRRKQKAASSFLTLGSVETLPLAEEVKEGGPSRLQEVQEGTRMDLEEPVGFEDPDGEAGGNAA